jgi:hypothetical protein
MLWHMYVIEYEILSNITLRHKYSKGTTCSNKWYKGQSDITPRHRLT